MVDLHIIAREKIPKDGIKASNIFPPIGSNYPPSSPIIDGRRNIPSSQKLKGNSSLNRLRIDIPSLIPRNEANFFFPFEEKKEGEKRRRRRRNTRASGTRHQVIIMHYARGGCTNKLNESWLSRCFPLDRIRNAVVMATTYIRE